MPRLPRPPSWASPAWITHSHRALPSLAASSLILPSRCKDHARGPATSVARQAGDCPTSGSHRPVILGHSKLQPEIRSATRVCCGHAQKLFV
eukprot:10051579-Alexandrium_andersonii.AAC.1